MDAAKVTKHYFLSGQLMAISCSKVILERFRSFTDTDTETNIKSCVDFRDHEQ